MGGFVLKVCYGVVVWDFLGFIRYVEREWSFYWNLILFIWDINYDSDFDFYGLRIIFRRMY